jgi:hypothetical protein
MKNVGMITDGIVEQCVGYHHLEYQAALCAATAVYLAANYKDDIEGAFKQYVKNLMAFVEEFDAKRHPDDMISNKLVHIE